VLSREIFLLGERGKNFYFASPKIRARNVSFLRRRMEIIQGRKKDSQRERVRMGAISSRLVGDDDKHFLLEGTF
jgi:hypothetical protein